SGFIQKPQLAFRSRIEKYPALQQIPMEIRDERTNVSQRVRMSTILPIFLDVIDVRARPVIPLAHIALIDAVHLAARRSLDVFVREEELAQTGVQCESVNPVSGGINHDRAGSVNEVTGRNLIAPLLQTILKGSVHRVSGDLSMDG